MKTTIKQYFVIFAVMIGVIAALSQLFAEPFNKEIINKRSVHKEARDTRDEERVQGMNLLDQIVAMNILPDSISMKAESLVASHKINEERSLTLFNELKSLKKADKIRNFQNLNSFLDAIGNPILLLITGILFTLFFIYRRSINWIKLSRCFIYLAFMYFTVASVYLIWALSVEMEINLLIYIAGILIASLFAVIALLKMIKYLFKPNTSFKEVGLTKAIRILFDEILLNIPKKGFLKEEKINDYTESNTDVISRVSKEIGE
jgi:hypothetical protein